VRQLLGPAQLCEPRRTHHWCLMFLSSGMFEKADVRIQELEQTLRQWDDLPLDMRIPDAEQNMRDELRGLRWAVKTTCPLNAVLIVEPPEEDPDLDKEREEIRRMIYSRMFGLEVRYHE